MKRSKILIIIAILILSIGGISIAYFIKMRPAEEEIPNKVVELDSIDRYGYILEDRDSALYKSIFEDLRDILSSETFDFEKYSENVAKLFIIDLYTIENKLNKYDVGGLEFILPEARETFEKKVQDTLYKYVEDNTYGKRTQNLPSVKEIEIKDIKKEDIAVSEKQGEGYIVELEWDYVKEDGYDKSATIEILKVEDKVYVTKVYNED